jgi:hypothetical protein
VSPYYLVVVGYVVNHVTSCLYRIALLGVVPVVLAIFFVDNNMILWSITTAGGRVKEHFSPN